MNSSSLWLEKEGSRGSKSLSHSFPPRLDELLHNEKRRANEDSTTPQLRTSLPTSASTKQKSRSSTATEKKQSAAFSTLTFSFDICLLILLPFSVQCLLSLVTSELLFQTSRLRGFMYMFVTFQCFIKIALPLISPSS